MEKRRAGNCKRTKEKTVNLRIPGAPIGRGRRPFNLVLGLIAGVLHAASAPAPQTPSHELDALACAPAPVDWTDCTITLAQPVPAGGSVIAAVQGTDASVAYCSDAMSQGLFYGAYGNEAVFYC